MGLQHRGNVSDPPGCIIFDQAAPHIQAARCRDPALFDQSQICRAAADVHVQYLFPRFFRPGHRAGAFRRQYALQIRPRRGHHKGPGVFGQTFEHRSGILFPGGFPSDDHRTAVHLLPGNACIGILLLHNGHDGIAVHQFLPDQRGKMYRTAVQHLPSGNFHLRHRKPRRPVANEDPGHDQLGRGSAHIQPHRQQALIQSPSPLPAPVEPGIRPQAGDWSCNRGPSEWSSPVPAAGAAAFGDRSRLLSG